MYISRDSLKDSKYVIEKLMPDSSIRKIVLDFLADKIVYASKINNTNWNLNLDKNANFLRFNTGHEYCIQINKKNILILCLKEDLKKSLNNEKQNIIFLGYSNNMKKLSNNIDETPECLAKVPDSIGCLLQYENINEYLPKLDEANNNFIEYAIKNTTILPRMKFAHSFGAVKYIENITNKHIPVPSYKFSQEQLENLQSHLQYEIKKLSLDELRNKALEKDKVLKKIKVYSTQFVRDPYVSEYVKKKANGICQDCKQPAPFINKKTGEPYLETHHIIPLSQGGSDTIDNVVALCPNCHRKRHYG